MCTTPTDAELAAAFDAHAKQALAIATAALRWHYGPTDTDPEPGHMWCYTCGAQVIADDDGYWCTGCQAEAPN